ncbi:DnaJ domain containing protein [Quillaja saponaria]|uniref:DnaJ domain containing protein n=1 Tax=Quillaja saponaria TaxID=32244 RepID=A0AAD7P9U6_QUISA|nr:DnaJ domain containing protein [Quillaja saponaria]KAJ7947398.1 DnaJ domain containing protein [Quillaja saponaria]
MECNKDEAVRAKEIAEKRMQESDFTGALKIAKKAQKLLPEIENINQMLTVCEVHCSAQNKLCGSEMDWYGILQVEQVADEATIKKQYRKLALLLHPDKNNFAGAEGAFKIIGEANRMLSDQTKRSLYDTKCNALMRSTAPKPPSYPSNGMSPHSQSTGQSFHQQTQQKTFWTHCSHCYTRFEFYKSLLNATLCCKKCSTSFTAYDFGYQGVTPGSPRSSFNNPKEAQGPQKASSRSSSGTTHGSKSKDKSAAEVGVHCKAEKKKDGRVARGGKEGVGLPKSAVSKPGGSQHSTNCSRKRVRPAAGDSRGSCATRSSDDVKDGNIQENGGNLFGLDAGDSARKSSRKKQQVSYTGNLSHDDDCDSVPERSERSKSSNTNEVELREAPVAGRSSNDNYSVGSATATAPDHQKGELKQKASAPPEENFLNKKGKIVQTDVSKEEAAESGNNDRKSKVDNVSQLNSNGQSEPEIIVCPDPDFSDFAKADFAVNQLWAIYDTVDGMPRFYARIKKIFSSDFGLLITWLEPNPDDQGEIDWFNEELPVSCGKYQNGGTEVTVDCLMFSHQMHCVKGRSRGSYLIYPRKGETWAIFKNWDIRWSSNSQKNLNYEFEFVEILSDFVEEVGFEVAYLGKVKGFVSLFQQTKQNGILFFHVPPNELYRFSHQVPSFRMTGEEREGVPAASFELDPAALPINLVGNGDLGDVKMEKGNKKGVDDSFCKSSGYKVEQEMDYANIEMEKMQEKKNAERLASTLRRSLRKLSKTSMDNGPVNASQYVPGEENSKEVSHGIFCQLEGSALKSVADERAGMPTKHQKNDCEKDKLKVRRSPRDLGKKTAQIKSGKYLTEEGDCKLSNANEDVNDSSFVQSAGSNYLTQL